MQILLLDCFECVISWLNCECLLQLLKQVTYCTSHDHVNCLGTYPQLTNGTM